MLFFNFMAKEKTKQLILLKVSDPYAGEDQYGLPNVEKFDIKMLRGNTIYNFYNCIIKSLSTETPELAFDSEFGYEKYPGNQNAEITIAADYFTMDYGDYSEIQHFNRMFDLNINATSEPSAKDKPKVVEKIVEKIVEKEVEKIVYIEKVPPTYSMIINQNLQFYIKLI